ncbi:MAG: class I SAM-dependent rRNA methyltransferase [Elusimicrobiales bacterium]|nr:class I SAM-dependent rRNA methyltransferase [Elusimicrobiales bacterium]
MAYNEIPGKINIGTVPPEAHSGPLPWVKLRAAGSGPNLFKRMLGEVDAKLRSGDIAAVYDKSGAPYCIAIYNPKSQIALRLLSRERADVFSVENYLKRQVARAVSLRHDVLGLNKTSNAYRLVHDHGDGLPGLTADIYNNYISLEFYSIGMFRMADKLEAAFRGHFPAARFMHRASHYTEMMEGFSIKRNPGELHKTRIAENGVQFEVNLSGGYKTGFFCDQRENRLLASQYAAGKTVLDVCSYTGGFGIYAKKLGGAGEVTCVELDEEASAISARNANINNARINSVCVDAFPYMRQMALNRQTFGLLVLDPYKLVASRDGWEEGIQKYRDFNRLALCLVEEGGMFVTCSCSGLVSMQDFQALLRSAAGAAGRRVQIFKKTGAGPDHPVATDYPEGEYLKAIWCRVF